MRCPFRPLIIFMIFMCLWVPRAHALLDQVQITNVTDMNLPAWSITDSDVTASMDLCIYTVKILSDSDYAVTAQSTGGFFLKDGPRQIPYALYWNDGGAGNLGASLGTQLTNNTKLGSRHNASVLSALCSLGLAGPNARLTLKITQADMAAALAGTYTGVLNITIHPN